MLQNDEVRKLQVEGRRIVKAVEGDPDLGPLQMLPGRWANEGDFVGRGWNMIALPFPGAPFRLLMNQFNETLNFMIVDKAVPNRGRTVDIAGLADQFIVALDYEQVVSQIAVEDFPATDEIQNGEVNKFIHHEPGLFLHMTNKVADQFDVARLGTIPHGDSLLALGTSDFATAPIVFPPLSGLPVGHRPPGGDINTDVDPANRTYLDPYKHFHHHPFKGLLAGNPNFPGFDPVTPLNLLQLGLAGLNVKRTMVLDFDTTVQSGGILNIPFVVAEANASAMRATFWIHELNDLDEYGKNKLVMQYAQVVMLDFLNRGDGGPGRIKWPHISINTMMKASAQSKPIAEAVKEKMEIYSAMELK